MDLGSPWTTSPESLGLGPAPEARSSMDHLHEVVIHVIKS